MWRERAGLGRGCGGGGAYRVRERVRGEEAGRQGARALTSSTHLLSMNEALRQGARVCRQQLCEAVEASKATLRARARSYRLHACRAGCLLPARHARPLPAAPRLHGSLYDRCFPRRRCR